MCRIKNLAILLGLCMVITACGSSEQQKSKVMLYQGDKNKKEEEHYKTTKVKKGTYEEKISATASLVYQNDKAVMIKDSNDYLDMAPLTSQQLQDSTLKETDINNAVVENIAAFVTTGVTDDSWNSFVSMFDGMGAADYVQMYQDAIDTMDLE